MLHHLLPRAATTTTTALLLLLLLSLGLAPAPAIATAQKDFFPDYAPWTLDVNFYDTLDGTTTGSYGVRSWEADNEFCNVMYARYDWISLTLRRRWRFVGWNNIHCTGEPLFEFKGRNVSYYEPPKTWQAYKVYWL